MRMNRHKTGQTRSALLTINLKNIFDMVILFLLFITVIIYLGLPVEYDFCLNKHPPV
jgi:hypothetical protein